ncbi:hypothetical protein BJY01DRAFT_163595 [Aspergillus pseudoustus]|uniref:Uncharacterized protein n=1 Tax=Aspergillus pseudoustus TaxID=1810923 RepID=A0ABR4IAU4_9EURO
MVSSPRGGVGRQTLVNCGCQRAFVSAIFQKRTVRFSYQRRASWWTSIESPASCLNGPKLQAFSCRRHIESRKQREINRPHFRQLAEPSGSLSVVGPTDWRILAQMAKISSSQYRWLSTSTYFEGVNPILALFSAPAMPSSAICGGLATGIGVR